MARRYKLTFYFFDTAEQAQSFCDRQNKDRYIRTKHAAHFTPWHSHDGKEHKFIAWYYTK